MLNHSQITLKWVPAMNRDFRQMPVHARTLCLATALVIAIVANLNTAYVASAQTDKLAIEQITENVAGGLIIRNLEEFEQAFDELFHPLFGVGIEIFPSLMYRPLEQLGIDKNAVIDLQGSGGIILLNRSLEDLMIRFVYPIKDNSEVAEALEIDSMELKAGSAYSVGAFEVAMLDGKMSLGSALFEFSFDNSSKRTPTAIDNPFSDSESILKHLSEADLEMFGQADAVLALGQRASKTFWSSGLRPALNSEPSDSELIARLAAASEEIRFGLAAIDIDQGIHIRSKSFLTNNEDGAAIQLIRDIRGGDKTSDLKFLPDANVLLAGAAVGNGKQNVTLAKAIVKMIVEIASPGEEVLTSSDKDDFYKLFGTVWQQLQGTRLGLYRNEGEIGDAGELALITIFHSDEAKEILDSLPELVRVANQGILNATPEGAEPELSFEFRRNETTSGEIVADILEIDTTRIEEQSAAIFQRFFGKNGNQIRFVVVGEHLVMCLGENPALLKATIDNLKNQRAGLNDNPVFVKTNQRLDSRRKVELHVSARNFYSTYSAIARNRKDVADYETPSEVASFALTIEEDRFGFDFWLPAKELGQTISLIFSNF